ncbi:hypothetical protein G9A89_015087 [Geosiphon pyriformis]|nr:hypothetical protein G9A89_015087 [Geosiphon pyriformis]
MISTSNYQNNNLPSTLLNQVFLRKRNYIQPILTSQPENSKTKFLVTNQNLLQEFQRFAYYAQIAYCLGEEHSFGDGSQIYARAIPDTTTKQIVVIFRGNKELTMLQWHKRNNGMVRYPDVSFGRVDFSFYSNFQRAEEKLLNMIWEVVDQYPYYPVILTGHGIGGVYGTFTALSLKKDTWYHDSVEPLILFTYGQPRIGDRQFSIHVEKELRFIYRITYLDDIVSQMPPAQLGFRHNHREYWVSPSCGCTEEDNADVYLCLGTRSPDKRKGVGILSEPQECNAAFHNSIPNSQNHWGPFFNRLMGQCPPLSSELPIRNTGLVKSHFKY